MDDLIPIPQEELKSFLKDQSTVFQVDEYPVTKIVNNELELKKLLVRCGIFDGYNSVENWNITNYDQVRETEAFSKSRNDDESEDDESEDDTSEEKVNVLYLPNSGIDGKFSYRECPFNGYKVSDIEITDKTIRYPCIVRIDYEEFTDTPLMDIIDGGVFVGYVTSYEDDE